MADTIDDVLEILHRTGEATGLHPGGEVNDLPRQRGAVVGDR